MCHRSVASIVTRLGEFLLRWLRLARHETDLDGRESTEISPEDYERLAIREVERYGADVPEPAISVSPSRPKRRRRLQRAKVSLTVRCVCLARAIIEVCALERNRALCLVAADAATMAPELNAYYGRKRARLTAAQTRLDSLGSAPFRDKDENQRVVELKNMFAVALRGIPLPTESFVSLPIKDPAEFYRESWNRIANLLGEAGLTQDEAASVLFDDFGIRPKQAKNRLGQTAFRARKTRAKKSPVL
jgi:hypothetical protein